MNFKGTFTRTAANMAKMGAYYTDLSHCKDIHKMFDFVNEVDADGKPVETCVLEPSIGDGSAVSAVTGVKDNPGIKILGVELNDTVAAETAKNGDFEQILKSDFIEDFYCSNGAFSFVFGNPPYMDDKDEEDGNVRLERRFLEKVSSYITKGGILVWVIPYRTLMEESYLKYWIGRYQTLAFYKFREPEFSKYKQVVIVGKRDGSGAVFKETYDAFLKAYATINMLPELPDHFDQKIPVPPSALSGVKEFRSRTYNPDVGYEYLKENPFEDVMDIIDESITVPKVIDGIEENPPIPLKKDLLYLVATCGGGSGLTGTEGVDMHLQRGHAEVVENIEIERDPKTGKSMQIVRTEPAISMTILEDSGKITHLV